MSLSCGSGEPRISALRTLAKRLYKRPGASSLPQHGVLHDSIPQRPHRVDQLQTHTAQRRQRGRLQLWTGNGRQHAATTFGLANPCVWVAVVGKGVLPHARRHAVPSCHLKRRSPTRSVRTWKAFLIPSSAVTMVITARRRGPSYAWASSRPSPRSPPASTAPASASASTAASPKPRLTPWPAMGCTACAASPTSARRGRTYLLLAGGAGRGRGMCSRQLGFVVGSRQVACERVN